MEFIRKELYLGERTYSSMEVTCLVSVLKGKLHLRITDPTDPEIPELMFSGISIFELYYIMCILGVRMYFVFS